MTWHSKSETPNMFMDVVVREGDMVYTQHIDYPSVVMRGDWAYVGDLIKELCNIKDLLRTLLYELKAEANSSDDYGTRKKAELLCEMIKLNLYGVKNDESN